MPEEIKKETYWNKRAKLNCFLLFVLIILVVLAGVIMCQQKEKYLPFIIDEEILKEAKDADLLQPVDQVNDSMVIASNDVAKTISTYENDYFLINYDGGVPINKLPSTKLYPDYPEEQGFYYDFVGFGERDEASSYEVELWHSTGEFWVYDEFEIRFPDGSIELEGSKIYGDNEFYVYKDIKRSRRVFQLLDRGFELLIFIPEEELIPKYLDLSSVVFKEIN